MRRDGLVKGAAALCVLLCAGWTGCSGPKPVTEEDKIEHLLTYVATLKDTVFVKNYQDISVEQGADTALWLATLPDDGPSGGFFRDRKPIAW